MQAELEGVDLTEPVAADTLAGAHGHRKILHDLGFLALVSGSSLARAILRILCRRDQRLSADGGWTGLAPTRRAVGVL